MSTSADSGGRFGTVGGSRPKTRKEWEDMVLKEHMKFRSIYVETEQDLLPDIPDYVTMKHIVSKLWERNSEMVGEKKVQSTNVESEQELLPGIPDHVTMKHIVPKLKWEACDVMQMVSREWRRAIRSPYNVDRRELSKSREAFFEFWQTFQDATKLS